LQNATKISGITQMTDKLSHFLRIAHATCIAFTGGGGKTSALFMAAREMAPALVTTSTHLAARQVSNADRHILWTPGEPLPEIEMSGVTLITGPFREDIARVTAPTLEQLQLLKEFAGYHDLPLLIEADGSRQKPLKAPAAHEPAIPPFADVVIVTAGMRGLDKPLTEQFIHRPEIFGPLAGLEPGQPVSAEAVTRVLTHPDGGLKNIPLGAWRVVLLNQADTPELQSRAGNMAHDLLKIYDAVAVASIQRGEIHAVYENIAGVVLAAGEASRFGSPKQLLDYHGQPFVRKVAQTALEAGLWPVVVVTGAYAEQVEAALAGLDVVIARNENWKDGQAGSVRAGIETLNQLPSPAFSGKAPEQQPHFQKPKMGEGANAAPLPQNSPNLGILGEAGRGLNVGGAIFLLADQPQVTPHVIRALVERHGQGLPSIVAPLAADRRANPVLFDRETFAEMHKLTGDSGGRALFTKFKVEYVTWHDESLLFDVDTEADYRKLLDWGVKE
jgi:molybdenum cofactor cytidylyltransferase